MFRRILFEDWSIAFKLIAFVVALTIFGYIFYRALRMGKGEAERIARIPLEDDEKRVIPSSGSHEHSAEAKPGARSDAHAGGERDAASERRPANERSSANGSSIANERNKPSSHDSDVH